MEDTNLTEENVVQEESTTTEGNSEGTTMTESEYLEKQKEALKKTIRIWTIMLIYFLVVGVVLCIVVYGISMLVMFVVNFLNLKKMKKFLEQIESGEAGVKEVYEFYQNLQKNGGKFFVLNFLFGAGFGVIGTIVDGKMSMKGIEEGEPILGDDYKNERIANDPKAQWNYCIQCKKNRIEARYRVLSKMTDGVICDDCLSKYSTMLSKRNKDTADPSVNSTQYLRPRDAIEKLSSKDLEERLEYLIKNQEDYSNFTPTRVICDGCLELDELNCLFRIARSSEFDSEKTGVASGLVHPYSAVNAITYEKIYDYDPGDDTHSAKLRYTEKNTILLVINNPYLKEEVFMLKEIPAKGSSNHKKAQIGYAEQTVKELQEIFDKPVMESKVVII